MVLAILCPLDIFFVVLLLSLFRILSPICVDRSAARRREVGRLGVGSREVTHSDGDNEVFDNVVFQLIVPLAITIQNNQIFI